MKLSIIIPVFNEVNYIKKILELVNIEKKEIDLEVIVVDDFSTDGTVDVLNNNKNLYDQIIFKPKNEGKGAAIIEGINLVKGDYILIQDADLEYNPKDYKKLLSPIKDGADIVYGSRFIGSDSRRLIYFYNRVANFVLTLLVNMLTNINFSDVETGYKLFKTDLLKNLKLKEKTFAFEIEVTMKLSKLPVKFFEVGIDYNGRSFQEGKKIGFKDGILELYKIFYYFFFK